MFYLAQMSRPSLPAVWHAFVLRLMSLVGVCCSHSSCLPVLSFCLMMMAGCSLVRRARAKRKAPEDHQEDESSPEPMQATAADDAGNIRRLNADLMLMKTLCCSELVCMIQAIVPKAFTPHWLHGSVLLSCV